MEMFDIDWVFLENSGEYEKSRINFVHTLYRYYTPRIVLKFIEKDECPERIKELYNKAKKAIAIDNLKEYYGSIIEMYEEVARYVRNKEYLIIINKR